MVAKIKNYLKHPFFKQLQDVRVLGLLAFAVLALLVSWNTITAIQTNYELQKHIAELQQENDIKKLENMNQELSNEYYKSDQFLELAARRQFGRAAPGETLVLVPKNVALGYTTEAPPGQTAETEETPAQTSRYQRNFQAWMDFFMHRLNTSQ